MEHSPYFSPRTDLPPPPLRRRPAFPSFQPQDAAPSGGHQYVITTTTTGTVPLPLEATDPQLMPANGAYAQDSSYVAPHTCPTCTRPVIAQHPGDFSTNSINPQGLRPDPNSREDSESDEDQTHVNDPNHSIAFPTRLPPGPSLRQGPEDLTSAPDRRPSSPLIPNEHVSRGPPSRAQSPPRAQPRPRAQTPPRAPREHTVLMQATSRPDPATDRTVSMARACFAQTDDMIQRLQPCKALLEVSCSADSCRALLDIFAALPTALQPEPPRHTCAPPGLCVHECWHARHTAKVEELEQRLQRFFADFTPTTPRSTGALTAKLARLVDEFGRLRAGIERSWIRLDYAVADENVRNCADAIRAAQRDLAGLRHDHAMLRQRKESMRVRFEATAGHPI